MLLVALAFPRRRSTGAARSLLERCGCETDSARIRQLWKLPALVFEGLRPEKTCCSRESQSLMRLLELTAFKRGA
jgi:hypothetical protein